MTNWLQTGSRKTHHEALTIVSWLLALPSWTSRTPGLAAGERSMSFPVISTVPTLMSMSSLREATILTQLAGWHPLPALQMSAAFLGCYLTLLSASGVQEHMGLPGKVMFYKSKCKRPELMVTLAACTQWRPLVLRSLARAPAVKITSPLTDLSEPVMQILRGHRAGRGRTYHFFPGVSPTDFSASFFQNPPLTSWLSLGKLLHLSECLLL